MYDNSNNNVEKPVVYSSSNMIISKYQYCQKVFNLIYWYLDIMYKMVNNKTIYLLVLILVV